jgi:hypothetical protein
VYALKAIIEIAAGNVRRVLLDDGWHAVEDTDAGSSFEAGPLQVRGSDTSFDLPNGGYTFIDHHTRKRLAGPIQSIRAVELG